MFIMLYIYYFNLLEISIYPIICCIILYIILFSFIINIEYYIKIYIFIMEFIIIFIIIYLWLLDIDIEIENTFIYWKDYILYGFIWYIVSELIIFLTIFISYLYYLFNSSIFTFNNYSIYLTYSKIGLSILNLFIIILGGSFMTINYYSDIINNIEELSIDSQILLLFSYIQYIEYYISLLSITDSIYGSIFYCITGLHGIHMFINNYIIIYSKSEIILINNNLLYINIHFLDIIFIIIYLIIY
uniref:Cytochrome c oxidase subunit 3 n=1 Tax=Rozella allomycis TaxID=281847 RepID=R9R6J7_9FUNG|nr:cytochrome c oxidase subunit 3 [Rozella allomycis]AGK83073.1 cytochrome c oxidase subunit 3 [Rozella allomycis]